MRTYEGLRFCWTCNQFQTCQDCLLTAASAAGLLQSEYTEFIQKIKTENPIQNRDIATFCSDVFFCENQRLR